jgi:hypothetical protein
MREVFVCLFLFVAPLLAQARLQAGAVGATVPSFEASIGYVYFSMDMPSHVSGSPAWTRTLWSTSTRAGGRRWTPLMPARAAYLARDTAPMSSA